MGIKAFANRNLFFLGALIGLTCSQACTQAYVKSVGGDSEQSYTRIYLTDFDTAWAAVLESLKSSPLEILNREGGFLRTKWIENTAQKNLVDFYGPGSVYVKAQFRFRVSVVKGFYDGQPSVRVIVQKEQFAQYDALDGYKSVISDGIEENTLLYRIARIIIIRTKLAKLDEARAREEIQRAKSGPKKAVSKAKPAAGYSEEDFDDEDEEGLQVDGDDEDFEEAQ